MPHKPGNGAIFGIVSEDGVAKSNFPVSLYDRTDSRNVSRQLTDTNGGFVFNGLNTETNDYQVVAQDEDDPPYKNALIRDRIQPVPGYQGATYWYNWLTQAQHKGAELLFTGQTNANGNLLSPYFANYSAVMRGNGSASLVPPLLGASLTPGAPQMPVIEGNNNKLYVPPRMTQYSPSDLKYGWNQNPATATLEFVADFSTLHAASDTTQYFSIGAFLWYYYQDPSTYNGDSFTTFLYVRYDPVAKTFTLYRNNGSSGNTSFVSTLAYIGDVDFSALQGAHHVIVSMAYGDKADVYIDGALSTSFSMSGTNASVKYGVNNNYGHFGGVWCTGHDDNEDPHDLPGFAGQVAAIAVYPSALTAVDAADLYGALITGTTPLLTGYVKEVVADYPCALVRCNEAAGATAVRNSNRPIALYDGLIAGTPTLQQDSIVVGGNTILFDGASGLRFNSDGGGWQSPNGLGYAAEWVGRPTDAVPAAVETLWLLSDANENLKGAQLQRNVAGKLELSHGASGTETITFDYLYSDTAAVHHFLVSVDKSADTASLHVDGVLEEVKATNTSALDTTTNALDTTFHTHIGGRVLDDNSVDSGHAGAIGEVAFYQAPLSAARAKAHYDARNTA